MPGFPNRPRLAALELWNDGRGNKHNQACRARALWCSAAPHGVLATNWVPDIFYPLGPGCSPFLFRAETACRVVRGGTGG